MSDVKHCWKWLIAHDWGPWKTYQESRYLRISYRVCERCGWESLSLEIKGVMPMGEPTKLICTICEEEFFLHPRDERPIEYADLCVTCEAFQKAMKRLRAEGDPLVMQDKDLTVTGWLILGMTAICMITIFVWLAFGRG